MKLNLSLIRMYVPKRYATELTNISKQNSKSLLMEVTSHHIGQLSQPDAFAFDVGLVKVTRASKKVKQLLAAELDLDPTGDAADSDWKFYILNYVIKFSQKGLNLFE